MEEDCNGLPEFSSLLPSPVSLVSKKLSSSSTTPNCVTDIKKIPVYSVSSPAIHGSIAAVDNASSTENFGGSSNTDDERRCIQVLEQFPVVIGDPFYNEPLDHDFALDIDLFEDSPLTHRPRRCSVMERGVISGNYSRLQGNGAVVRRSSNFASPITVVRKKDGTHRVYVDYTRLNNRTKDLNYPLPLISSLYTLINKKHRYFTVLDLKDAFLSLPSPLALLRELALLHCMGYFYPYEHHSALKIPQLNFVK